MKLNNYFNKEKLVRDAEVHATHYANSSIKGTFTFALNDNFINEANLNKNISAIITTQELSNKVLKNKGLVVSENVKEDFFKLHNYLVANYKMTFGVIPRIADSATISKSAYIGNNVFIGENVKIGHFTVIEDNSSIDDNTIIGPHVTIGARGLHNTRISDNEFIHVFDAGGIKIGKNCEVLSGCVIQKSYFCEPTIIDDFTKLGPQVNVGHGTKIGKRCLVAGGTVIAGFNDIGDDVWIGPSSVFAHGLNIGNGAAIKLGSVVVADVIEKEHVSGNFAYNHRRHTKQFTKNRK